MTLEEFQALKDKARSCPGTGNNSSHWWMYDERCYWCGKERVW